MTEALAAFIAEMRALGVKSFALELDSPTTATYFPPDGDSMPTEAPPAEPKPASQCQALGCTAPSGGIFGAGTQFCATHALGEAGVK